MTARNRWRDEQGDKRPGRARRRMGPRARRAACPTTDMARPPSPAAAAATTCGPQWAAMIDDGGQFIQAGKGRRRAHPQPGGDRQPARLQPRRRHAQRQFRHPGDHRLGDGLLRAPADAGDRLRPAGPADDDLAAQLHLRQRRSLARPHHLGALRRLSQLDPAAGHPGGVQGRGVGQFRPGHRRLEPDLLDHRRAARRPPRPDRDPHRGPALHDDRDATWSSA